MGTAPLPQDAATAQHATTKAVPAYPYAPHEYQHLHIVGHLHNNGQYLPVKVFIAPEMVQVEQGNHWQRAAEQRGVMKGLWRGIGIACVGWVIGAVLFLTAAVH